MPRNIQPRKDAKVIHISADPLETRYPFRELEADLYVQGSSLAAHRDAAQDVDRCDERQERGIESRRKALAATREEIVAKRMKFIDNVKDQTPIHPAWLAACVNQVKSEDAIVISELGAPLPFLNLTKPQTYMGSLLSGGLGFGMGAGLGAKLAAPERDVIVTVGDGSYMFGNPLPYHFVGAGREPADADGRRQQPDLARGAAVHARRASRTAMRPRPTSCRSPSSSRRPITRRWSRAAAARARRSRARRTCCRPCGAAWRRCAPARPPTLNVLTQARR